jgi:hypothetical protein
MHHMRSSILQEILEINGNFETWHCSISIISSCHKTVIPSDFLLSRIVKFRERHLLLLDGIQAIINALSEKM